MVRTNPLLEAQFGTYRREELGVGIFTAEEFEKQLRDFFMKTKEWFKSVFSVLKALPAHE